MKYLSVNIKGYEFYITGTVSTGWKVWDAKDTLMSVETGRRKTMSRREWYKYINKQNKS